MVQGKLTTIELANSWLALIINLFFNGKSVDNLKEY